MRKHYAIPRYPQEMEVGRHPVLQPVDVACPNAICRSKHEISCPQGGLMTRTVMKRWETRPKYPKDNTKPLSG